VHRDFAINTLARSSGRTLPSAIAGWPGVNLDPVRSYPIAELIGDPGEQSLDLTRAELQNVLAHDIDEMARWRVRGGSISGPPVSKSVACDEPELTHQPQRTVECRPGNAASLGDDAAMQLVHIGIVSRRKYGGCNGATPRRKTQIASSAVRLE
jgi:hypothetical protein